MASCSITGKAAADPRLPKSNSGAQASGKSGQGSRRNDAEEVEDEGSLEEDELEPEYPNEANFSDMSGSQSSLSGAEIDEPPSKAKGKAAPQKGQSKGREVQPDLNKFSHDKRRDDPGRGEVYYEEEHTDRGRPAAGSMAGNANLGASRVQSRRRPDFSTDQNGGASNGCADEQTYQDDSRHPKRGAKIRDSDSDAEDSRYGKAPEPARPLDKRSGFRSSSRAKNVVRPDTDTFNVKHTDPDTEIRERTQSSDSRATKPKNPDPAPRSRTNKVCDPENGNSASDEVVFTWPAGQSQGLLTDHRDEPVQNGEKSRKSSRHTSHPAYSRSATSSSNPPKPSRTSTSSSSNSKQLNGFVRIEPGRKGPYQFVRKSADREATDKKTRQHEGEELRYVEIRGKTLQDTAPSTKPSASSSTRRSNQSTTGSGATSSKPSKKGSSSIEGGFVRSKKASSAKKDDSHSSRHKKDRPPV
ncbi:MAG: hypothetical protein M1828_006623 [Chrysothrix sp. TS-e1954]|nr:MAG: hypothetical protein M1828_006623 [Chrysothrix sp. TS-e1954]